MKCLSKGCKTTSLLMTCELCYPCSQLIEHKFTPQLLTLKSSKEDLNMTTITLRDYFAAKVLPSVYSEMINLFQEETEFHEKCSDIAYATYELADAMVEASLVQPNSD
jgi:isocitrate dehydrogenase kinase/phosphatase